MVKLLFKSASELKDVIGLVSCINDEVCFKFDENGFMTRVMDPRQSGNGFVNREKRFSSRIRLRWTAKS